MVNANPPVASGATPAESERAARAIEPTTSTPASSAAEKRSPAENVQARAKVSPPFLGSTARTVA